MAIVVSSLTGQIYDPIYMCNWSVKNGYYAVGSGSYHSLIPNCAKDFGLNAEGLGNDKAKVVDALNNGKLVVALMGKGTFTNSGHFIVLRGITSEGKQTSNLYVINVENIEKGKNIDKIEKVTKEENQILEMFEQTTTGDIKDEVKLEETKNNSEDKISTDLKEKNDTKVNKIKPTKLKNEMDRDSLLKNIDKTLFILEMVKTLCSFKYSNFKNTVLKNVKKLVGMKELSNFGEMDYTPVHFYTPYN